jgi:AraC-like DNA-binding protein
VKPTFAERTSAIDDDSGEMAIRLVVDKRGDRTRISAKRPTLIVPVEAGVVDVACGALAVALEPSAWLLVAPGARAVITANSVVAHTLVLGLSRELLDRVAATYASEIDVARFERYLAVTRLLVRTTWVNELCHRYLFERAVCQKRDNQATRFLETELGKELYFLCHEHAREIERQSPVAATTTVVRRALAHLEDRLFEPDVLRTLARAVGASSSTLLRAFKREVGESPLAYVRTRRLDEALMLLKSQRLRVAEVSSLVGYRNFAAFSHAFHTRFGVRPSDVRVGRK